MIPTLTSVGLTVKRPVFTVTARATERSLTVGQPQVSTGMEFNWHCIHVRLQLFQPYQSPNSALKHIWGKGLRHLIPHFTDEETEVVNGMPHSPGIQFYNHSRLLQPLKQTAKSKVGNYLRNLLPSNIHLSSLMIAMSIDSPKNAKRMTQVENYCYFKICPFLSADRCVQVCGLVYSNKFNHDNHAFLTLGLHDYHSL